MTDHLPLDRGLFGRLRRDTGAAWDAYVDHDFVRQLGAGTLPRPAFEHFLRQDYLFLIHFARAYALAGAKAGSLADLRAAAQSVTNIVDIEMPLHVAYCREWGLSEADMEAEPEAMETIAYTRIVLDRGHSGDKLDLDVALAPCVVGYAEAVARLLADPATTYAANPYAAWIDAYAGADYRGWVTGCIEKLDSLGAAKGAEARYPELLASFRTATLLETAFWDMAMRAS